MAILSSFPGPTDNMMMFGSHRCPEGFGMCSAMMGTAGQLSTIFTFYGDSLFFIQSSSSNIPCSLSILLRHLCWSWKTFHGSRHIFNSHRRPSFVCCCRVFKPTRFTFELKFPCPRNCYKLKEMHKCTNKVKVCTRKTSPEPPPLSRTRFHTRWRHQEEVSSSSLLNPPQVDV